MRNFKDKTGQTWTIDLTVGDVLRVKAASEGHFNLFDPSPALVAEIAGDELAFWELLWHLVEPQAQQRQLTAEQFGQAMAAECLFEARTDFFEEWQDFFRQLHRPEKAAAVAQAAAFMATAIALTLAHLQSPAVAQLKEQAEQKLAAKLNASFGSWQASLASTPEASPGGSSTGLLVGTGEP